MISRPGWLRWRRARPPAGAVILLYHRVVETETDPWDLCVSQRHFAQQLEVLSANRTVIPLSELAARQAAGRSIDGCAAITFDDGYIDNFQAAAPLLDRHGLPATFFLVSGALGQQQEFWWDMLQRLVLCSAPLPAEISLCLNGRSCRWSIPEREWQRPADPRWRAEEPPRQERQRIFFALWHKLQQASEAERGEALARLAEQVGNAAAAVDLDRDRPMTPNEACELGRLPGVDIASHSVTHPPLALLDGPDCAAEMTESRSEIAKLADRAPAGISYPYGSVNKTVAAAARAAGYVFGCCSAHRAVAGTDDPMLLPRISVGDWSGARFERALDRLA